MEKKKNGSVVKSCTCHHEYQDMKYGSKQRVHNIGKQGDTFKCTVCATIKK